MEKAAKIIRRSVHTLLKDFHYFTSIPAILLLPFSSSLLLSLSFCQPSSLTQSIFQGKRISFPVLDLPRMIFILVFSLPLALSSLALAKASIIQSLNHHKPVFSLFCRLLWSVDSSSINPFFDLAAGIVFYMVLTNTMVICNLALVVAGTDNSTVYKSIHKACLLRKGTNSMALVLALPVNLGLAATEALFRYRVVRAYDHVFGRFSVSMVLEGLLIAYLFSLLVVLDTISSYLFIRNCDPHLGREGAEICVQIKIVKDDNGTSDGSQGLEMVFED
ncbi:formin protein [Salix suchowensis]|nr:formin protein [Salix suchowensis]